MKKQLFLLHFAGGNSYSYNFLKSYLGHEYEFISLELPGRGKRFQEDLIRDKREAIDDYVSQIKMLRSNEPYVLYGHSMGATLGLSVTKIMEEAGDPPNYLVVSGNAGPGLKDESRKNRHLLGDAEFKEVLIELGGIPDEVLDNDELYEFFAPIIRADFEVLEKDNFSEEGTTVSVPIYTIMGDREDTVGCIENWKQFTSEGHSTEIWAGNHFFIHNQGARLVKLLEKAFERPKVLHL